MTSQVIVVLEDGMQKVTSAPETDIISAALYAELVEAGCTYQDKLVVGTPGLGLGVVVYTVGPEWARRHVVVRHA